MQQVARARSIIHVSPEAVMDAFINPVSMSKFWFHRRDEGLRPDESVMFYLGDAKDAFGFTVQVIDLVANSEIHLR
ncbi:MAG: hypothetical protein MI746_08960 [Pseudomonadales bacterium]|nr:hypothetical protein [Pseudomonadales bacterium]